VKTAEEQNGIMRIFTVGLGSTDGSLIPLPGSHGDAQFVKDENGQIVKSRLDEERLRKIAESTGGFYVHLLSGPAEMEQIARDGLNAMKQHEAESQVSRRPIERYQWPLGAGLVLLILSLLPGERRRLPAVLPAAAALLLLLAVPVRADIPFVGKNSGVEAYENQDYKGALDSFSKQIERRPDYGPLLFDDGAAAYKAGDYDHALDSFSKALASPDPKLREKTEYNLGNTLFQHGAAQQDKEAQKADWNSALQHYQQALKADPKDGNAAFNQGLVTRLLREMKIKEEKQKEQKKMKEDPNGDQKGLKEDPNGDQKMQKPDPNGKEKSQQGEGDGKDGEKKDGDKPGGGKDGEKKDGQAGESKEGDASKPGDSADHKKEGKVGAAKPGEGKDGQPQESKEQADARQAAEDARAASAGVMTPQQAKNLLESMRSEDRRVRLYKPGQDKPRKPVPLRDW
jgi:Ca-activated chloride channel family protein